MEYVEVFLIEVVYGLMMMFLGVKIYKDIKKDRK